MARYFARVKAIKGNTSPKRCCIMFVPSNAMAGQPLTGRCLPSIMYVSIHIYIYTHVCIASSTDILPCRGVVHPWTNPTYALADLAAIVQHLLLGIRCLGIRYLHELSLRIAFTRAADNDALLEDKTLDSSIHTEHLVELTSGAQNTSSASSNEQDSMLVSCPVHDSLLM